jgi:hypothetical protein
MTRKFLFIFAAFALMPALLLVAGSAFAGTLRIVVPDHDIAAARSSRKAISPIPRWTAPP